MSHELFGERFLSKREIPWHNLGIVTEEDMTAREALTRIGEYQVVKVPLSVNDPVTGEILPLNQNAILRLPTPDDNLTRQFGIVSDDYTLITPQEACDAWDTSVGRPVETIGSLKRGSILFITTPLPKMDIKGDEVDNYLIAYSPMTGSDAAEVSVSPVRVVCMNTLKASQSMSSQRYRIIHDRFAKERFEHWLASVYNRALEQSNLLGDVFNILASKSPSVKKVKSIITSAYPYRNEPGSLAPDEVVVRRMERWDHKNTVINQRREAAMEFFEGRGTGLDHPSIKGTYWALYNAVVEVEDYRRARSDKTASEDLLFGRRAQTKERAFNLCLEGANN